MNGGRPVTIIGGGLAGLTLGIALRQREVPAILHEAGHYPRHRVCGEFINGCGRRFLNQLGLEGSLSDAGALVAETAAFHSAHVSGPVRHLPQPALSLSRYKLDALLADQFRSLGGDLREGERRQHNDQSEGLVQATGRRAQAKVGRWRWFGLKVHARGVRLDAHLEMHVGANGYVGLTQLTDGLVNVCGLFRRPMGGREPTAQWQEQLRGTPGTRLRERLSGAEFDAQTFCAVAGLDLRPQRANKSGACRVGDALTMIAPFTGNGMSMAFESAERAVEPLCRWSRGEVNWPEMQHEIGRGCDAAFARRLLWARLLHCLMFVGPLQSCLVRCLARPERMWRFLFERTR